MLRQTTLGGWAIGSDRFKAQIEALTTRRAVPLPKGCQAAEAPHEMTVPGDAFHI